MSEEKKGGQERFFILPHGGYRNLLSYQKAEIVFDATVRFCERFLNPRDRTYDQMVQAARSGKQNLVEGSAAAGTSKKTEITLTGVARSSLEELLTDYQDFLRTRDLPLWDKDSKPAKAARRLGVGNHPSYESYRSYVEERSPETSANVIICLIHQTNYLIDRQIKRLETDFVHEGGLSERMTQARLKERRRCRN
jgi:four helix bundle suffix protein